MSRPPQRRRIGALIGPLVLGLTLTLGAGAATARPAAESASEFTEKVSTWSSRAQYGRVWKALHPRYQRVTSRAFWEACQRKRQRERDQLGLIYHSIKAIDEYPDAIRLPLLGRVKVTAVTMQADVEGTMLKRQKVTDTVYVMKVVGAWKGLWEPESYQAYAKGKCPA